MLTVLFAPAESGVDEPNSVYPSNSDDDDDDWTLYPNNTEMTKTINRMRNK